MAHEANAFISDEVSEVVEMIDIVVFNALSVVVDTVVVEPTVADQTLPLVPAGRHVRPRVLVQIFAEVACNEQKEVCGY